MAILQNWGAENASAGTTLATGSATVTTGSILVIYSNSDTNVSHTITKNAGTATIGTVTARETQTEAATAETSKWFTCPVTAGGTLDLLLTTGASDGNRQIYAIEIDSSVNFFGSNSATDTGSNPTPTLTVASVTLPAFGISFCVDVQGGTPAVGTGWTNYAVLGSAVHFVRVQTLTVASAGSVTADFGNAGFDRTNSALLILQPAAAPTIDKSPASRSIMNNDTTELQVFATTSGGALSYQWQDNRSGSFASCSDGTGATSQFYTTASLTTAATGRQYRCVVTDSNGSATSSAATVTVVNGGTANIGRWDPLLRIDGWF